MALQATSQTAFTGPVPNRNTNVGSFLGSFASGLLGGASAKRSRKLELADEQRKTQATLLGALINKGEIVPATAGQKGAFDFAGFRFAPVDTTGGFKIRSAEDFKNFTQGLKNQAETKFKAGTALAGIMSKVGEAAFFSGDPQSSQEFITKAITRISDLLDGGQIDQVQAEFPYIPRELLQIEVDTRSGRLPKSTREELSSAFDAGIQDLAPTIDQQLQEQLGLDLTNPGKPTLQRTEKSAKDLGLPPEGKADLSNVASGIFLGGAALSTPVARKLGSQAIKGLGTLARGAVRSAGPIGLGAAAGDLVGSNAPLPPQDVLNNIPIDLLRAIAFPPSVFSPSPELGPAAINVQAGRAPYDFGQQLFQQTSRGRRPTQFGGF